MKMTKRIFVCLTVLALCVALIGVVGFADGTTDLKYNAENYKTILEYYEEPVIFGFDFEADNAVSSGYVNDQLVNLNAAGKTMNTTGIVSGANGKYISIKGGNTPVMANTFYFNWNATDGQIDDFNLAFDVSASGTGNRLIEIYVADTTVSNENIVANSTDGIALVKIDFKNNKIMTYNPEVDGFYDTTAMTFSSDVFYNFFLNYSVANNKVDLTVTLASDGSAVGTVENILLPFANVTNVRFGSMMTNMMRSTLCFDNIVASGGSFARLESDTVPETERAIADFNTLLSDETVSAEVKVDISVIGMKLITVYGATGTTDAAKANVINFQKSAVAFFAEEMNAALSAIVPNGDYNERSALVNKAKVYYDLVPADISFMGGDAAAVTAVVDAFKAELVNLETFKTHSEAILAALADAELTNTNLKNYGYMKPYYEAVVNYTPYVGYPGIAEIYDSYVLLIQKFEEASEVGAAFVLNSANAADTTKGFGERFAAFVLARDNYFEDSSYPGIDAALACYASVAAEMNAAIEVCDGFLLNISRADYSQYLSAKKSALAEAGGSIAVINEKYMEYPGVVAGIEQYEKLVAEVTANEAAASAYVAAVNALKDSADGMTNQQLAEAIKNAEELQKTGNVIGVDGVTEANIVLNNLKSRLELAEGYKAQFNTVIGKIEASKSATEVFALVLEAQDAIANAEKYDGVDAAGVTKLNAKIADYNAKVQALNAGFKAANELACNTVSASSGSPTDDAALGRVIALVKKFFE